jgi:TPP-dependent pyruvate/acetoin dehydrogenase alpha subunit
MDVKATQLADGTAHAPDVGPHTSARGDNATFASDLPLDHTRLLAIYRVMTLIRAFELECLMLLRRGEILGVVHPYVGHEAIAASVCPLLRPSDKVVSYYRCHGHALALGVDPGALMAEMFGRATGCCGGQGGSMHIVDTGLGFLGGNSIVGAGVPIAAGVSLACQLADQGDITTVFLGDGAMGAGCVLETLNIAAVQHLPLVFVCENNLYQDQTRSDHVFPDTNLIRLPSAFGIPAETVDGNVPSGLVAAAERALAHSREGRGPFFIEARTYLGKFHSQYGQSEPREYRPPDEVARWRERDPLRMTAQQLEAGGASPAELGEIVKTALEAVEEAVRFARASPEPSSRRLAIASEVM